MITSWEQFDAALARDEPLPLLAISTTRVPRHILPEIEQMDRPKDPLEHPAVLSQLNALKNSLRGETPPSVLHSLIMESPQTIGSIAASAAMHVEAVDQVVEGLTEAGLTQVTTIGGLIRVTLTIPVELEA